MDKIIKNMPNIDGEQTELELENQLIEQLRVQFHSTDEEDVKNLVNTDTCT